MNLQKISLKTIATVFLCLFLTLFFISSLDYFYYTPELKSILDKLKVISLIAFLATSLKGFKFSIFISILCLITINITLLSENIFLLQATTGIIIAWTLYHNDNINALLPASIILLALSFLTVMLVQTGLVESKTGLNLETSGMQLTVSSKNHWAMWHPNIISSLITACCLAFYYLNKTKLYILTLIVLAIVAMETISRTYLFIPLLTIPILISKSFSRRISKQITTSYKIIAIFSLSFSLLLSIPNLLSSIVSSEIYNIADQVLSYRLSIFNSAINQLSSTQYFFGSLGEHKEVDSFFINLIVNNGIIVYLTFSLFTLYSIIKNNVSTKSMCCIATFLLLGNFEDISGSTSIAFIIFTICIIEIYSKKSRKTFREINS